LLRGRNSASPPRGRRATSTQRSFPWRSRGRKGTETFARDEAPRPDTTVETLARLKPAFRPDGTITAGNAPGLNSAAAAMIVAERGFAEANGIEPMARLAGYGVAAVEPGMFGLGPVPAVRKALDRAGWSLSDLERIEINEAFAAVPIAVARELGLPEDIINVEGGAVAHGPRGCSWPCRPALTCPTCLRNSLPRR
jgi:acetyl-CoA C-acetyltransferase